MTLPRARIIKGAGPTVAVRAEPLLARRIAREILDSQQAAEAIVARAQADATALICDAEAQARALLAEAESQARAHLDGAKDEVSRLAEDAMAQARHDEQARIAAALMDLHAAEATRRAELSLSVTEVATLLAERLIGEELATHPQRIAVLAHAALEQTRGARLMRVHVHPADEAAFSELMQERGWAVEIVIDPVMTRGSFLLETDAGMVDGELRPQLARLMRLLREAAPPNAPQ